MSTYPIALNPISDIVATGSKQNVIKDGLTDLHEAVESLVGLTGDGLTSIGFRRRNINGDFAIDQRNAGASQTITAGAANAYTVDRYYAYCSGANVSGQRVAGTLSRYVYQFTGASGCTKIGFGHRMPASDTWDLAGKRCTISADIANSLLSTVSWTAWYANTEDAFGTLASPTRTQIATGTITVTSTMTRYSVTFDVPAAATTGIEIEFSVGAQTSGTWKLGRLQVEGGSTATPFERRPYGMEEDLCQMYLPAFMSSSASGEPVGSGYAQSTSQALCFYRLRITPRVPPSGAIVPDATQFYIGSAGMSGLVTANSITFLQGSYGEVTLSIAVSSFIAGQGISVVSVRAGAKILFTGCEL